MHTNKRSSIIVAFINVIIICLSQYLYFSIMNDKITVPIFQFLFLTLIFLPINIFLWFSKFKIEFYHHWVSVYIGFFCSILIFYIINYFTVDTATDFPPGEAHFDLFLTILAFSFIQLITLLCFNGITYLLYKNYPYLISKKNK
ncbi:hypothetical protein [Niallia sp. 03133]|uniref:hypothetical protein n=1 Tax=Niallia sp. 03133 TaxID=3458060 RepID=UPI0040442024